MAQWMSIYLGMEDIKNNQGLDYNAASIAGEGVKLEEGFHSKPPFLVSPHHLVSMDTRVDGEVEDALLGLLPWTTGDGSL